MSGELIPEELETLAGRLGISCLSAIVAADVNPALLARVPLSFARGNTILPLAEHDGRVRVAIASAAALLTLDELRLTFGKPVEAVLVPAGILADTINHVYAGASGTSRDVLQELEAEDLSTIATEFNDPKDLLDLSDEAPVIRLLNSILSEAVKERASDIHIEPYERDLLVRFRIDGLLYEKLSPPQDHSGGPGLTRQDHGRPEHRREAPAPGRPHPCARGRPRRGHPRLDHPDLLR